MERGGSDRPRQLFYAMSDERQRILSRGDTGVHRTVALARVLYYIVHMSTTLTIRTDQALRQALAQRARAQGKTVSEVAREILAAALEEHPLERRTGHLRGRLGLRPKQTDAWRKSLRKSNWRL